MCFCLISKEYEDRDGRNETQLSCRDYCAATVWEEKYRIWGGRVKVLIGSSSFPKGLIYLASDKFFQGVSYWMWFTNQGYLDHRLGRGSSLRNFFTSCLNQVTEVDKDPNP